MPSSSTILTNAFPSNVDARAELGRMRERIGQLEQELARTRHASAEAEQAASALKA